MSGIIAVPLALLLAFTLGWLSGYQAGKKIRKEWWK